MQERLLDVIERPLLKLTCSLYRLLLLSPQVLQAPMRYPRKVIGNLPLRLARPLHRLLLHSKDLSLSHDLLS